jgi:hypothetical protein
LSAEAALAVGYAVFLVFMALGIDRLARHSHHRSGRYRTAGFTYDPAVDAWTCPEGEFLHRLDLDHSRGVVRYRARAAVCNACPAKDGCTDSDDGREIVRAVDPWPHSEVGRFHRGLSAVLLFLAAAICVVAIARNQGASDLAALATCLAVVLAILARMIPGALAPPPNAPGA